MPSRSIPGAIAGGKILPAERDYDLARRWLSNVLAEDPQPSTAPEGWKVHQCKEGRRATEVLQRELPVDGHRFTETIVGFPSAPVYTVHRRAEFQVSLERINWHTLRLYRATATSDSASRIYLLHNGLNELDDVSFYYRLISQILARDPSAACIIRPFPGHLWRHPFQPQFAQRPLDTYLEDPGNLFRQFLRYMLESQWLLSTLVPCANYPVMAGLDLNAPRLNAAATEDRTDTNVLANSIMQDWMSIWTANLPGDPSNEKEFEKRYGGKLRVDYLEDVLRTIRGLIGWSTEEAFSPYIHSIGYSLGGYVAQSVFFTWPFAVSSCTTICSGGALRDVALTAFAHPEEWRTVVHGVAYELESAMLESGNSLKLTKSDADDIEESIPSERGPVDTAAVDDHRIQRIAGIHANQFTCFYHIFRDVFVQEERGSYGSRIEEYMPRLFFVVGGQDPIVSPRNIIDASSDVGANILEIAELSHFPGIETEWQPFWLPLIARTISDFAQHCETTLFIELWHYWGIFESDKWEDRLSELDLPPAPATRKRRVEVRDLSTGNIPLDADRFLRELEEATEYVQQSGHLFVFRNDVPTALLGSGVLLQRGAALHHSDAYIARYLQALCRRATTLRARSDKLTLVLPANLRRSFTSPPPLFSPKVEAWSHVLPTTSVLEEIWENFVETWKHRIWWFDPDRTMQLSLPAEVRDKLIPKGQDRITNTLPDIWLALSNKALLTHGLKPFTDEPSPGPIAALMQGALALQNATAELKAQRRAGLRSLSGSDADVATDFRVVKVSAAAFNQRFMGWRVDRLERLTPYVVHGALAMCWSSAPR